MFDARYLPIYLTILAIAIAIAIGGATVFAVLAWRRRRTEAAVGSARRPG